MDFIPIISPIGYDSDFKTYNINADTMSGAIASSIPSERLIMLTDVNGVVDKKGNLLTQISISEAKKLIKSKTINGGMIPKVETCIEAVKNGVKAAVLLNGKLPNAILLEMFTEHGVGTLITKNVEKNFSDVEFWLFDLIILFILQKQKFSIKLTSNEKVYISKLLNISQSEALKFKNYITRNLEQLVRINEEL